MINLLIDTSLLKQAQDSFGDIDFQKILHHSKANEVKIFIPFIVWEERRTQLLDNLIESIRNVNKAYKSFAPARSLLFKAIPKPNLTVIDEEEARSISKTMMESFAKENNIEILPLAPAHAERAWTRYFDIQLPFNAEELRENRRKDIPDSWILEAAIDLKSRHEHVLVLIKDGKLTSALNNLGFGIATTFQEALDSIARCREPAAATPIPVSVDLTTLLKDAYQNFKEVDVKVLGYIAYMDGSSKEVILELLTKSGIPIQTIKNVADRLVIAGMIGDTGNHYILLNKTAGDLAAKETENEIIKLIAD